jgi:hypothetical protein
MTTASSNAIDQAKEHVEEAVRTAGPVLTWLARLGFVAKGVVYTLVGGLALLAALDRGGDTTDQRGALRTIQHQPFGRTMLAIAAIGLLGYALWRLIQAIFDPEHVRHDAKSIGGRVVHFFSGAAYGFLAVAAWRMIVGSDDGTADRTPGWTAQMMAQPAGPWLVGAVGLIVICVGAWQFYRAWRAKFGDKLVLARWGARMRDWIIRFGRLGYAARGVIFCLIGTFMIAAANHHNPGEAKGVGSAMHYIEGLRFGWVLLMIVALGLIAYGVFQLVEARYRKIEVC